MGVINGKKKNQTVNKCIAVLDDSVIYAKGDSYPTTSAGGIVGFTLDDMGCNFANLVAVAEKIKAFSATGNANFIYSGNVIGHSDGTYDNVYSYSNMEVSAANNNNSHIETNIIGAMRTKALIKRASFLNTVFGPEYQSLAHLEEDPEAVWVIKDGEYPELYFTVLNDITVSDVEHGTISVDKTQAVDDEIVTVTAVPDNGYKLNKIYVNGEEITGTTFTVAGDSDVYATFAEIPAEYRVSVAANANASAGLVNVDSVNLQGFSLFAVNKELSATDGEEIKVNTQAAADYTVDAIYVNGEELAGDSFIVTDDSVVTMDAVSISTDVKATTYEAANVGSYYATLSGSVEGDNATKYIRYWSTSNPSEVYTTEAEVGNGTYSVTVSDLELGTEYQFQMTEYGEVKSFTTSEAEPDGEGVPDEKYNDGNTPVKPTPTPTPTSTPTSTPKATPAVTPTVTPKTTPAPTPTTEPVKRDMCFDIQNQSKGKFSVSANVVNTTDEAQSGLVIYAAYDGNGKLVKVDAETITDLAANATFPVEFAIADGAEKYKILVWDSWKSMLPIAASVDIE